MTLEILNCFHGRNATDTTDDNVDDEPLECNYDKDVTYLYQAIEEKAFMAAIDFLESRQEDVVDQCRTWVTRYEPTTEEIRWSQLPLHAALIFKAPVRVIELLVKQFPKAVRCTDDQKMLPLHLAFRYGASDNVLHLLLKEFPEAMTAKDKRERLPLDYCKSGTSWKKGEIIDLFVLNAKTQMDRKASFNNVSQKLDDEVAKTKELTKANATLKTKLKELAAEMTALKATSVLREIDSSTSTEVPPPVPKSSKSIVKVAKVDNTTPTTTTTTPTVTTTAASTSRPKSPLKNVKRVSKSSKTLSPTESDRSKRGGFFKTFGKKLKETTKDKGLKTASKTSTKTKVAQSVPEDTTVKSTGAVAEAEGDTTTTTTTVVSVPEGTSAQPTQVKSTTVVSKVKTIETAVKDKFVKGTSKVTSTTTATTVPVPVTSATTAAQQ